MQFDAAHALHPHVEPPALHPVLGDPVVLVPGQHADPAGRPTVYALVGDLAEWVFPVGRLDKDTSGLLILTNDHRLGHRLTDPGHHVPKTYHARVRGVPDPETLRALAEGVDLGFGTLSRPAAVRSLGSARGGGTWLEIVLTEGRNRQVRRMCAAVGHDVLDLVRVAVGALALGDLGAGEWRRLDAGDLAALENPRDSIPARVPPEGAP